MDFEGLVTEYKRQFPKHGTFEFRPGEQLRARCAAEGVPEEPGAYLIYGRHGNDLTLLYVGKAGTLACDGTFKEQKLFGRFNNKQGGMRRQEFFTEQMAALGLDGLVFTWFVTYGAGARIIPAKAEADLLQEFFDENGRLPEWTESV